MSDTNRPDNDAPSLRRAAALWLRQASAAGLLALVAYLLVAYLLVPLAWIGYAHQHPALDELPGLTETADDHPGDPINLALIGTETQLKKAMLAAGWFPADPITLKSCLEIAAGTVLHRSYEDAPVSALYFWGRKQDLAFEQPVGDDPRRRHHVRLWHSAQVDEQGRPLWVGSATYDERVGLSHTTGQITHHIAPDVDAERDHLVSDLERIGGLTAVQTVAGFHQVRFGRNGGGDPWHTDGGLKVGVIAPQ